MGSFSSKAWEKCPVGSYSPWNTIVPRDDTSSCRQKRILLIGTAGSGKSAFVNTIYTALFGTYRELARCGGYEGHISKALKIHDLSDEKSKLSTELFKKDQLPVLVDMCGLPPNDSPTDRFENILRLILRGRLPLNTNIHGLNSNEEAEIPECDDGVPIDRVVFVAAANVELPTAYCDAVRKVCEEVFGAEFSLFGVLTKGDQLTSKTKDKYDTFVQMLRAVGTPYKVLVIANYCSAVCGDSLSTWKDRKDIDDPILAFLAEISRSEYD